MSSNKPGKDNHMHQCNSSDNDYDDEDDFISFQYESQTINLYYTHLSKYSRLIRKEYLYSDVQNRLPQELHKLQTEFNVDSANIFYFFQLLQKDFTINEKLSFKQYTDFYKISEFLQSKKIAQKLSGYFSTQKADPDFAIQIILSEIENSKNKENYQFQINKQMETTLSEKVNECIQNKKFSQLPLHCIYRIIEKCDMKNLSMNFLYDFIKTDLQRFNILFSFINIKKLSDDRIDDLYGMFTKSSNKPLFTYLKCNLDYIMELRLAHKKIQKHLSDCRDSLESEINKLQKKLDDMESDKKVAMKRLDETEKEKVILQSKIDGLEKSKSLLEQEKASLQERLNKVENQNKDLKDDLNKSKSLMEQEKASLQRRIIEVEKQNNDLKEELESNKSKITGVIEAKVKSGLVFNAEIKLNSKGVGLDTTKSKYIVSTSNAKSLGASEYEKGEPITSLDHFTTIDLSGKPGTYYVRAFIVGDDKKSFELVSNPVTISGNNLPIEYEGKARQILLAKGRYRLEVWGGEGGSSNGSRKSSSAGQGGKGGYSCGTVSLTKSTKFFVFVGGHGKSANQQEGADTEGAFPDGGGTTTGHDCETYTTVPGTGGGSTSIRVSSDSIYSRVIVAGGGGGADSDYEYTNLGSFGGGATGGNGYYQGNLKSQGAGTQTGSTPGPKGSGSIGIAGTFGKGAHNNYHDNYNTGGGGGGGWYGGGSGGYRCGIYSTSGGGGSGWIFTESSFNNWKSSDLENAKQFRLDNSLYLTNATTVAGNSSFPSPNGNGNETGHSGNGYAKITPE